MVHTDLSLMFLRFAQIVSNDANLDAINYYLGQYYFYKSGDYKTCFDSINKGSPLYLFGRLDIAERDGDFKAINKIVRKNPLFIPAVQYVVREHIKNGEKSAALSVLNRALRNRSLSDEGRAFFLKQRAYVYLMFNDAKRAQKDIYDIRVYTDNITPDITSLQVRTWVLENRNLDEAYKSAMMLVQNNTSDVYAWDLLSQIVAKKESVENALELLESVSASGANMSAVYEHLGDLYKAQGDKEKALRAYQQALDLSDDCLVVVPLVQKKIRNLR
jgi:tetratricopeptide (TPR) repeat protein